VMRATIIASGGENTTAARRGVRACIARFGEWWARRDSNPQPRDYESPALPLSYRPVFDVGFLIVNGSVPASRKEARKLCEGMKKLQGRTSVLQGGRGWNMGMAVENLGDQ